MKVETLKLFQIRKSGSFFFNSKAFFLKWRNLIPFKISGILKNVIKSL